MQGRMTPRLIGFLSEVEREFFELFCSVDGVGVRKALRAMVRPVKEVAVAIEEQDTKFFPRCRASGRPCRADHRQAAAEGAQVRPDGQPQQRSTRPRSSRTWSPRPSRCCGRLGHSESDARRLLDAALAAKKKYADVQGLSQAIYQQSHK